MDDIIIIDDFLNEEELSYITSASTYKDDTWVIHGSSPQGKEMFEDFYTSFLQKNLMDNEYYTSYLLNKINKTFNYNYKLVDVYLNGHEPLRHGSFHIDGTADRTVILYITPWKPAWGGFTHFMKSQKEHDVIAPIYGRLINFKSDIPHKGYSFCNQNCPMRITAAFKLKL
tara:strand:- start:117 stop:629 length:513 start_codon:yes stop_codon:yes gene_type:complete